MNRLCIFSFFNKTGDVADYVLFLLKELKTVSDRLIFVANGSIDCGGRFKVAEFTDEILVRKNLGFDAGAYKYALEDYLRNDLSAVDELIFCNDTFWGPFIPMKKIFSSMGQQECDFWGMAFVENNYVNFIPSFFLVFRKNIVSEGDLFHYITNYIDKDSNDIHSAYAIFETGLFDYLTRIKGFSFSYYADIQNVNIYGAPNYLLRNCGFPLLKRRCVSAKYFDYNNIVDSLHYIKTKTGYDYQMILEDLKKNYGVEIKESDIQKKQTQLLPHSYFYHNYCELTPKKIEEFIDSSDSFYIFGAGIVGCRVYWRYAHNNKKFKGFVVSDGKMKDSIEFMKEKLYHVSDLQIIGKRFLVAVNIETFPEIKKILMGGVTYYI